MANPKGLGVVKDMLGRPLVVGQQVARPYIKGRTCKIEIHTVTRIENRRVYISGREFPYSNHKYFLILDKVEEKI